MEKGIDHQIAEMAVAEKLFVFDEAFEAVRARRMERRAKELGEGVHLPLEIAKPVVSLLIRKLASDHPAQFFFEESFDGSGMLSCKLTGELLSFDSEGVLVDAQSSRGPIFPKYVSAFDALCSQTQAEIRVLTADERVAQGPLVAVGKGSREAAWPIPETGLMIVALQGDESAPRPLRPVPRMKPVEANAQTQAAEAGDL